MSDIREIRSRMKSVSDTEKITKAMYMISSSKMRKAKSELDRTKPHFDAIRNEIKRLFRSNQKIDSPYMFPEGGVEELPAAYAYIVITSDKGLAGYYNHAIIKAFEEETADGHPYLLYMVGEYGRRYCKAHDITYDERFAYSAENPTLRRSREMASIILDKYDNGEISKIFLIYTDMKNSDNQATTVVRLLPFHRGDFITDTVEREVLHEFEYHPSAEKVLEHMVYSYIASYLYDALIDSYCSEQSARMNAMDEADKNAEELLNRLNLEYNHARQGKITQEITEISAGAKALKKKKERSMANNER